MANRFIGIEIGGTKLQLVIGDDEGNILERKRYAIDPNKGADGIQNQIQACLNLWKKQIEQVAALAVGFGGPVNWKEGSIEISHQVDGWANFNLKTWLEGLLGKPVVIENDANVATLAEALYGQGKSYNQVFYMTIGSGIGAGLVINGNIYHGKVPGEVEIGHVRLNKEGDTLESCCSGWAVNRKVRKLIDENPDGLLAELAKQHHGHEALLLKPALVAGDAEAKKLIFEIADNIAFAISHVVHLFHPEVLIIGGGLSLLGEDLRKPIEQQLNGYLMKAFLPAPPVKIAALAEDVVPIGALELAKSALKELTLSNTKI